MEKKLYRSRTNKTFSGVCGGLAEYINMDATVIRVLWVLVSIFVAGFPGLIVYIIMACVIPEAPVEQPPYQQPYQQPYQPPYQQPTQNWQQPQQGWQPPQQPPQENWQPPQPPPTYTPPPAENSDSE